MIVVPEPENGSWTAWPGLELFSLALHGTIAGTQVAVASFIGPTCTG